MLRHILEYNQLAMRGYIMDEDSGGSYYDHYIHGIHWDWSMN